MDHSFYKSLAALGEVGTRKASYRTRVFAVIASLLVLAACAPWVATSTMPGVGFVKLLVPVLILCVFVAEARARKRLPSIIFEVAQLYGVSPASLHTDALKHVDSAA